MHQFLKLLVRLSGTESHCELQALVKAHLNIVGHFDVGAFEGKGHADHLIQAVILQEVLSVLTVESKALVSLEERNLNSRQQVGV